MKFTKSKGRELQTLENTQQVRRNLLKSILQTKNIDQKIMFTRSALLSSSPKSKYGCTLKKQTGNGSLYGFSKAMSLNTPFFQPREIIEEDQTISVCQVKSQYVVQCQSQTDFFTQNDNEIQFQSKQSRVQPSEVHFQSNCQQNKERQNLTQSSIPNNFKESKLSNFSSENEGFNKKFSETAETFCSLTNSRVMTPGQAFFKKKDIYQDQVKKIDERDETIQKMKLKIEQLENENKKWQNKAYFYKTKLKQLEYEIELFHESYKEACN